MDRIEIKGTKVSPEVLLDPSSGVAEISGESYPENSVSFYAPLMEWLEGMIESKKPIEFSFKLDYFNTSSSKCIIDIVNKLDKYHGEGGKASVKWYYDEEDEDMLEAGEDFSVDVSLPFEMITHD
ncbi:MAG: DUF1987 domain-containing protein [Leptospira sp.]|nr:DUF1987 domain-containing protein [Leptospira sp.]